MKLLIITAQSYQQIKDCLEHFFSEMNILCKERELKDEWIDSQEVCVLLNISKRTLHSYKLKGLIPYSTIGGKSFFKVSDIKKQIEKLKKE